MTVITNKFMTYSTPYLVYLSILYSISIAVNALTISWFHKLQEIDCKCSQNWMGEYIKYFLYAYFAMLVVSLIVNVYLYVSQTAYKESQVYKVFRYVNILFAAFGFANMIIAIIYIEQLRTQKCECSEDVRREVYWYYNIIRLVLVSFMLLIMISAYIFIRSLV